MNIIISIIVILVHISLWRLIGKYPDAFIRLFPNMIKRDIFENRLHVFSAETSSGDEAEFTDEGLLEKNKFIGFFRIILSLLFLGIITCLLFYF